MSSLDQSILDEINIMINKSEEDLYVQLGIRETYRDNPSGKKYSKDYEKFGKDYFRFLLPKIQEVLCINGKPKGKYNIDSIGGLLITAAIGDITSGTLSVIIALIYKFGIEKFCRLKNI